MVNDLVGKKFGRLTVISRDNSQHNNRNIYWICKCDCGNECIVQGCALKSGATKSCGCLNTEHRINLGKTVGCKNIYLAFESNKKYNQSKICGDYVKVYFNNCDDYMILDLEDYDEKFAQICWYKQCGYALAHINGKNISAHRYIMKCNDDDIVIHHINGNKLDNRKNNLCSLTREEHISIHRKDLRKEN